MSDYVLLVLKMEQMGILLCRYAFGVVVVVGILAKVIHLPLTVLLLLLPLSTEDWLICDGESAMTFPGVTYLGSASIVAPKTEEEIYKNMEVMNRESKCAITVNLIVPDNSEGFVR